ncbi:TetR family transcriptional regulator [Streptococcus loxodontisalivarius]|uniref:AcrR family transcriptional regulator n=1 Tax=Streptococcus loxodontisalivarius TaxID=1349415 RepID=A0ABS2PSS0_9STRE|nr:TetR family transcriptional regulator [Streptococcus loxodontisalivarius]MBM7643092.1 AcrR family transcriptional regulator [Streptococcus loxodontisalivarius]
MAKISKEETIRRREEILEICQHLYEHRRLKDITINEIGKQVSFSRTAIYSYFNNKEEIFLALLKQEYEKWIADLESLLTVDLKDKSDFASAIATSLDPRSIMLKILAIDMESLDAESRMEHLISFKVVYGKSLQLFQDLLRKHFPDLDHSKVTHITFAFFPFLYGVYPYVQVTEKQKEAMDLAAVPYSYLNQHDLIEQTLITLL